MNDQTPEAVIEESPEALAYFTDQSKEPAEKVEVAPEELPDKPEEKAEDPVEEAPTKATDPTPTFFVQGREVPLEEAIKLVNSISGDNTRLAGEYKKTHADLEKAQRELEAAQERLKNWEEYGTTTEKPPEDNLPKIVEQVKQSLLQEERQKTFTSELDEIASFADYTKVLPKMQELAEELGDKLTNVSPKKLYKMARGLIDEPQSFSATAEKIAAQKTAAELAKINAKKVVGGGSSTDIKPEEEKVSPEVAAYFDLTN